MDVRISLLALHCSNQGLTGERDTSFPNELRSHLRWTSKSDSAGRLRWTSNRAKLPVCRIQRGGQEIGPASLYKDRKSGQEAGLREDKELLPLARPLGITADSNYVLFAESDLIRRHTSIPSTPGMLRSRIRSKARSKPRYKPRNPRARPFFYCFLDKFVLACIRYWHAPPD